MNYTSWMNGVIGGLLVSSCCIIQLFLNLFGIGCAGLNTLLLPYRSIFISLTVISLTYSFFRYRPSKCSFMSIIVLTLFISFSPELLRIYNNQISKNDITGKDLIVTKWEITGMHCEACRSAVIRSLRKIDKVLDVNVELETRQAQLISRSMIDIKSVMEAVESAGFQARKIE